MPVMTRRMLANSVDSGYSHWKKYILLRNQQTLKLNSLFRRVLYVRQFFSYFCLLPLHSYLVCNVAVRK